MHFPASETKETGPQTSHLSSKIIRVRGSISQKSDIFSLDIRNSQCTSMATVALCVTQVLNPDIWGTDTIDNILLQGNELHIASRASYTARFGRPAQSRYLFPDEVQPSVTVFGEHFQLSFPLDIDGSEGRLSSLVDELNRFFSRYKQGIFTCSLLSLAIFKENSKYYVFDSHSRDETGLSTDNGKALLSCFNTLHDMTAALICNCDKNAIFVISRVVVDRVTFAAPQKITSPLIKDQHHGSYQNVVSQLDENRKEENLRYNERKRKSRENETCCEKETFSKANNTNDKITSETPQGTTIMSPLLGNQYDVSYQDYPSQFNENRQLKKLAAREKKRKSRENKICSMKEKFSGENNATDKITSETPQGTAIVSPLLGNQYDVSYQDYPSQFNENRQLKKLAARGKKRKSRENRTYCEKETFSKANNANDKITSETPLGTAFVSPLLGNQYDVSYQDYPSQLNKNRQLKKLAAREKQRKSRENQTYCEKETFSGENNATDKITFETPQKTNVVGSFLEERHNTSFQNFLMDLNKNCELAKLRAIERKRKSRENEEIREREKSKDAEWRKRRRADELLKKIDLTLSTQYKQKIREIPAVRVSERLKDKAQKKKEREDLYKREKRREDDRNRKKLERQKSVSLEKRRQTEAINKQQMRQNEFFSFREKFKKSFLRGEKKEIELKRKMINSRSKMPDKICAICKGLFFEHSVITLDLNRLKNLLPTDTFRRVEGCISDKSGIVCRTCQKYTLKGEIPKLAMSNNLEFPHIPSCLKDLSPLEERMVAPFINFMQIRPLKPNCRNPQLGLKGSVVNIPVEVNEMIQVLPRHFDNMATVQVKLKRHIEHSTDYMYEAIQPARIVTALQYLKDTPLYQKHGIVVDESYIAKYKDNNTEINFIVDQNDILDSEINLKDIPTSRASVECEGSGEEEEEGNDEVLLVDRDREMRDRIKIMAPGQGKSPVPWHLVPDLEELSFPTIFCGQPFEPKVKISYTERVKSEIRRSDRRSCVSTRLLYMAKKKLELALFSSINTCLRKNRQSAHLTAGLIRDKKFVDNMFKDDWCFRILDHIRSSPYYWEQIKKNLMAMIRQLGRPSIFLTLSAAESRWPELLQCLAKINEGKLLTLQEALSMDDADKTLLIRKDPVTCARYFDHKVSRLMWFLKQKIGPFKEHCVIDSYERVEFQMRGSPHEHIFLWLKDAPSYDPTNPQSVIDCINFIDKFITCEFDPTNPFMSYVTHKHTHACYKGKKHQKKCRFNFPVPPMPRTTIINPVEQEAKTEDMAKDLKKIRDLCESLYRKPRKIEFKEILSELGMTAQRYIDAIRSSLKRSQVFLKRSSLEVGLNSYNKDILCLFEANIDVQFILEEYGVANYIINYISKSDAGLSKMLREAMSDIKQGYTNVRDKLNKFASTFINGNLMGAQEAVYHVNPLPLSKFSRASVFVNTSPIAERTRILKRNADLDKLNPDSEDIFQIDIHSKYSKRPAKLNDTCLADFATMYNQSRPKEIEVNDDELEEISYQQRSARKILRYTRYRRDVDPANYFREHICLFLPWRIETDEVENCDYEQKYLQNLNVIEKNRAQFSILPDEILEEALNVARDEYRDLEEEEEEDFLNEQVSFPSCQRVDILEQSGKRVSKEETRMQLTAPQRISLDKLQSMFRKLNPGQRQIIMHVLQSLKTRKKPLRIFLSGSAGVGKSFVINTIYQAVTRYFDNMPRQKADSIKVLLTAFSGKAAYLINGVTLHTAFNLPITQYGGIMPELSAKISDESAQLLFDLKLLIVDEISMVGSRTITQCDQRLRQIMGRPNNSFGNVSVIFVGDLNQLPPVMDSWIFLSPSTSDLSALVSVNPLWQEFELYALTQIMRQQNEKLFVRALNNLSLGSMTIEDLKLLKSREVPESEVPNESIRLFSENIWVNAYNDEKISKTPGKEHIVTAKDVIMGKISSGMKERALQSLKSKKYTEVGGLPYDIRLKLNIKYMITINIDVEDGLVNGSCGVLKFITFISTPNSTQVDRIWLDFGIGSSVGTKQRLLARDFMKTNNIDPCLVPITRKTHSLSGNKDCSYQSQRTQFPIVPAEALTIHKSQGQTYQSVCLDISKCKRITRPMLYVALSRVTSLTGLYILGQLKAPRAPKDDDPVKKEMERLKQHHLQLCYWNLENKSGLVIAYHNVRSLNQHFEDILADDWYSRCDILIFAETRTVPADIFEFPSFRIVYRCDSGTNKHHPCGLLCLVKIGINIENVSELKETNLRRDINAVRFTVNSTVIVSGYKPPSTSVLVFKNTIRELISEHTSIIVLGDFNFNIIGHEDTHLLRFMKQFGLTPSLDPHTSTTNFNTQIDVIFSNFQLHRCGVYESYFSDHKVVYGEF